MQNTNIFYHAPKELVMDAFLTWLLFFLDSSSELKEYEQEFWNKLLLKKSDYDVRFKLEDVNRQVKGKHGRPDLIVEFTINNQKKRILFENKTRTSTSVSQLSGYQYDYGHIYKYIFLKLSYINAHEKELCKEYNYLPISSSQLLKSLEGLSQALVESAAASSKVVFMVRPNSSTKKIELSRASNGDIITGSRDDVSTLQVEKQYDLRVVSEAIQRFEERMSYAFLLNSAVQRDADRVTAEEIRYMANELETALGGVYSLLSQEFQLPLVRILMERMSAKGTIPKLPKGTVRPTIITGVEALGRGNDLQKLREFTAEIGSIAKMNPEVVQMLNLTDLIKRIATGHGIDTEGLIKSEDQLAAEQQAAQEQAANQQINDTMQQAAPGVAGKMVDAAMQQQQTQE